MFRLFASFPEQSESIQGTAGGLQPPPFRRNHDCVMDCRNEV